jgi:uncharacterized protein
MNSSSIFPPPVVLSPCIGVCALDANGLCEGCFRTGDEIGGWIAMSDERRLHIMETLLPEREARFARS